MAGLEINDFDRYQGEAVGFAIFPESIGLAYTTLGLTGEAGEVADKVKKIYRDGDGFPTDEQREQIAAELGDVLWYVANCADQIGYGLSDIAEMNIAKLSSRQERGVLGGSGDNR